MNMENSFEPHLMIRPMGLPPAGEWALDLPGWVLVHVTAGQAYSIHPKLNQELQTGAVAGFRQQGKGYIRASQLGDVSLHFFRVEPEKLTGLVTLGEQQFLQSDAGREPLPPCIFPPAHPVSEKLKKLCTDPIGNELAVRLQLLEIFTVAFGNELKHPPRQEPQDLSAKGRMARILRQMPAASLLELSFGELTQQLGCTPRHVSRVFNEVVGVSFREKQTEVRLLRARELLATTQAKVLEVAMESGYQSVSLFNLMFKRHFGVTPRQWRQKSRPRVSSRRGGTRLPALRA
jgi:AraC-like DNA-binding protein